jgi:hypothetical protein
MLSLSKTKATCRLLHYTLSCIDSNASKTFKYFRADAIFPPGPATPSRRHAETRLGKPGPPFPALTKNSVKSENRNRDDTPCKPVAVCLGGYVPTVSYRY